MKTYEIYNLTTGEVLADNLSFYEVPELYGAYEIFYSNCELAVCYREVEIKKCRKILSNRQTARNSFMSDWICLMDELTNLGNLY